jgi:hypothetical protein
VLFHTGKLEQLTASALVDRPLTHNAASANNDFFIDLSLSVYFFRQKDAAKKLKKFLWIFDSVEIFSGAPWISTYLSGYAIDCPYFRKHTRPGKSLQTPFTHYHQAYPYLNYYC